ncbi:MAG: hypothetical protein JXA69_13450 [Phycisphaerae bacterium]|nr:hypothetical protein [Phycisphaerae bacterium]
MFTKNTILTVAGLAAGLWLISDGATPAQAQCYSTYYNHAANYYAVPAPVVVQRYYAPPPVVVYRPAPVIYRAPVVAYRPAYVSRGYSFGGFGHGHRHHGHSNWGFNFGFGYRH